MPEKQRNMVRSKERFPTIPAGSLVTVERTDLDKNPNIGAPPRMTAALRGGLGIGMGRHRYLIVEGSDFYGLVKGDLKNKKGRLLITVVDAFAKSNDKTVYEYELKGYETSHSLRLENKYGKISLPNDAIDAKLDYGIVTYGLGSEAEVAINKSGLKGILLEVHGGQVFMGPRIMVVTRVENIHVPFYLSHFGTSGKKQGVWYPFFGATHDGWLIKTEATGKDYHPSIAGVQDMLNENLVLPAKYIWPSGEIGRGKTPSGKGPEVVKFALSKHLEYQNFESTEFAREKDGMYAFIKRITGYDPEHVISSKTDRGLSSEPWVQGVLAQIKTPQDV